MKATCNFVEVNGIGTVRMRSGETRDVFVYGYFRMFNWAFMVHADVETPEYCTVSEASTGCRLENETYYTVDDALYYAIPFIENKRYYFATRVGEMRVHFRQNLEARNTTLLQTLAIDSLL